MIRAFVEGPIEVGELRLSPRESHYVVRVRRARCGTEIEVLDGAGGRAAATLLDADPRGTRLHVHTLLPEPRRIHQPELLAAVVEPDAMDELVATAVALDVGRLHLVASARAQRRRVRLERLQRVMRAAMRQCGRPDPMVIEPIRSLDTAIAAAPVPRFVAHAGATPPTPCGASPYSLLVGPEGGFAPDELAMLAARGCVQVGLGRWTLRSPLAAAAGLVALRGHLPEPAA